ncbi:protein MAINTENANCE OF MERISTEMS [Sesamum angolense]|uniref:Protein MAINTENANCE OF MERISTEMS n=1 Tax=Sesamum angolense TaxID=2727404 RepID=A0AAE2BP76_9LAMI|nr:protein MAINTENANCE OF MERISTEMS [Sesamum angolense]
MITALVERWRSETHTFHFRVGEATITLQDVQVIWALPIDGEPVTGIDFDRTTTEWQDYCLTYLGFRPSAEAFEGSRLQTHAIKSHIVEVEITPDTPHEIIVQYARAIALLLLGEVMCPDSSGNTVPLLYLTKLEDIVEAKNYSWGSAVLAFLYRELCNASTKGKAAIGGALQLLQFIWQPYDMDSDVIVAYATDFKPPLWEINMSFDTLCNSGNALSRTGPSPIRDEAKYSRSDRYSGHEPT